MRFIDSRGRLACSLTTLLFGVLPGSAILAQSSLEDRGDSLYAHFDYPGALEAYRSAVDEHASFEVMFKLAVTSFDIAQDLEAENRRDEAEEAYRLAVGNAERVRDAYGEEAGAWFILAATTGKMAQFSGGRSKVRIGRAVEEYYKTSLSLDSTYALAYLVGGIFNREVAQLNWVQRLAAKLFFGGLPNGSLEESRRLLERALEIDPVLFMAHWELAQTLIALRQKDPANAHLRFLRVLAPRNSEERRIQARARAMLAEVESSTDDS